MATIKSRKITKIVREFVKQDASYDITGVDLGLAKYLWRVSQDTFQDLAAGDYRIDQSNGKQTLVILNAELLAQAEAFQVGYVLDFTASEYDTEWNVDINQLKEKYNTLVQNTQSLWEYVRLTGFIADDTTINLILPQLDDNQFWFYQDGKYKAYDVSDFRQLGESLIEAYVEYQKELFELMLRNARENIITTKENAITEIQGVLDALNINVDNFAGVQKLEIKQLADGEKTNLTHHKSDLSLELSRDYDGLRNNLVNTANGKIAEIDSRVAVVDAVIEDAENKADGLNLSIQTANNANITLVESTNLANTSKNEIKAATSDAVSERTLLDNTITTAISANSDLVEATETSGDTLAGLVAENNRGLVYINDLGGKITQAAASVSDINVAISDATTSKNSLEASIGRAATSEGVLNAVIVNATTSKNELSATIANSETAKNELVAEIGNADAKIAEIIGAGEVAVGTIETKAAEKQVEIVSVADVKIEEIKALEVDTYAKNLKDGSRFRHWIGTQAEFDALPYKEVEIKYDMYGADGSYVGGRYWKNLIPSEYYDPRISLVFDVNSDGLHIWNNPNDPMPIKTTNMAGLQKWEETEDYIIYLCKDATMTTVQNYVTGTFQTFQEIKTDIESSQELLRSYSIEWSTQDSIDLINEINNEALTKLEATPMLLTENEDNKIQVLSARAVPVTYECCFRMDKKNGEFYIGEGYENFAFTAGQKIEFRNVTTTKTSTPKPFIKSIQPNCKLSFVADITSDTHSFLVKGITTAKPETMPIMLPPNEYYEIHKTVEDNFNKDLSLVFTKNVVYAEQNGSSLRVVKFNNVVTKNEIKLAPVHIFERYQAESFSQLLIYKGNLTEAELKAELAKDIKLKDKRG